MPGNDTVSISSRNSISVFNKKNRVETTGKEGRKPKKLLTIINLLNIFKTIWS